MDAIKQVDVSKMDFGAYRQHYADCVVLRQDGTLFLQKRPDSWRRNPGTVNLFGGHVDAGEDILPALVRELHEETGAVVKPENVVFLGALTENATGHAEVVHVHFWHDAEGTITGCYEAESISFPSAKDALAHEKLMDYARWALMECVRRGLLE